LPAAQVHAVDGSGDKGKKNRGSPLTCSRHTLLNCYYLKLQQEAAQHWKKDGIQVDYNILKSIEPSVSSLSILVFLFGNIHIANQKNIWDLLH